MARNRVVVICGALAAVTATIVGLAQVPSLRFMTLRTILPLTESLSVKPIREGAYWVSGGISNTGFVIGNGGVILIDAQMFVPTARTELAAIASITAKPIDTIILTHSDPDHINGLPAYSRGIEIIAQENAKSEILQVVADPNSNGFPPSPDIKYYVPTLTIHDTQNLVRDGIRLVLIHTAAAHTDGDLAIYLPTQRIVFAGDLLTPSIGPYPGIHLNKGGSSLGWLASMKVLLDLDADIYIPGHGELMSKAILTTLVKHAEERRAEISALFRDCKTLKEIKAELNDVPLKGMSARFPTFIETTFQELASESSAECLKRK